MKSDFKEAKISILILAILLFVSVFICIFAAMFTSMGYKAYRNAAAERFGRAVIVLDPGHGGEDPGAVANGVSEKDINLDIALRIRDMLSSCGYDVVMTRYDDRLLYGTGEEGKKKYFDLRNRVASVNGLESPIFVSIHQNKFPAESCKGLQVFYSGNSEESRLLADMIQEDARLLQPENRRSAKCGSETVYILEKLEIPAVLVECGFISNRREAELLSAEDYRESVAFSIFCSICRYLTEDI